MFNKKFNMRLKTDGCLSYRKKIRDDSIVLSNLLHGDCYSVYSSRDFFLDYF